MPPPDALVRNGGIHRYPLGSQRESVPWSAVLTPIAAERWLLYFSNCTRYIAADELEVVRHPTEIEGAAWPLTGIHFEAPAHNQE